MPKTRNMFPEISQKGFTLIEVMISILILAAGLLAVASMQGSSISENALGRRYTEAATTAADWLESLSTLDWDDALLTDTNADGTAGLGNGIGANAGVAPDQQTVDGDYDVLWNIADDDLIEETKTVALYVTWQDRGMTRSVRTRYVIAQRY